MPHTPNILVYPLPVENNIIHLFFSIPMLLLSYDPPLLFLSRSSLSTVKNTLENTKGDANISHGIP